MAATVYEFQDYRAFLLSHAQSMKQANPRWSYGSWARRLGLKTTSSITKVIQGQRNPGDSLTEKLVHYFAFEPEAASHFRDLVRLHRFKRDPRLCGLLMQKMPPAKLRKTRLVDPRTFERIFHWYFLAVREMVRLDKFLEDPHWIAHRLRYPLPKADARAAIRLLLQLGLLQRDERGRLQVATPNLDTQNDVPSEAIRRYHQQVLKLASLALENTPVDEREFGAEIFVVQRGQIPAAKTYLRTMKKDFVRLFEKPQGDAVYQFQFQLFPLTR